MIKACFINVLDWRKATIMNVYPVIKMNLNEVTNIGTVKEPPEVVAMRPTIEKITLSNDGWLIVDQPAGLYSLHDFLLLASRAIMTTIIEPAGLVADAELEDGMLANLEIAAALQNHPEKLYSLGMHLQEMDEDPLVRRRWITNEINRIMHPEHLVANPSETDS